MVLIGQRERWTVLLLVATATVVPKSLQTSVIEWLIATLPLLQLSKDNSDHNIVDLHDIQTYYSSKKKKKKNQYNAFISAEGAELPVSCWPSVGLYTLSSLNDRRCKYALTLCQAEDHPGDTPTQRVCERETDSEDKSGVGLKWKTRRRFEVKRS